MVNIPLIITPFSLGYNITSSKAIPKGIFCKELQSWGIDTHLFDMLDNFELSGMMQILYIDNQVMFIMRDLKSFVVILKDEDLLRQLHYDKANNAYSYREDDYIFLSDTQVNREEGIAKLCAFITSLMAHKQRYKKLIIYNDHDLYYNLEIINPDNYYKVCEDDAITLYAPNYRPKKAPALSMDIVLTATSEIIGHIAFSLKPRDADNFAYDGNVEYRIRPLFQNQNYATRALKLVRDLTLQYGDEVNKELYIAIAKDNRASIKVALKCGGQLYYDGEVPKNHELYIYDHLTHVLVYKI